MSEVEIPHAHEVDAFGKKVGVTVAVIGIFLSAATISSHRQHTAAVVYKTEANDQWAYYQAKKIREYEADVGTTLVKSLATDDAKAAAGLQALTGQREKYAHDAEEIQEVARQKDEQTEHAEAKALRFDLGEGFLELGLVLSSLYFLSRKRLFPTVGWVAAAAGVVLSVWAAVI
jgi:uncharacterized protein DUF4337